MTTVTQSEAENPKTAATAYLNLIPSTTVDVSSTHSPPFSCEEGDESKLKPDGSVKASSGEVTNVQKKMKRAERFGTTVKLSESEKRNSRAERFGTGSTVNGSDTSKEAEELKKKARAERFGIVKSTPADEEVKKKARLSRFGSSANNDPINQEKKKTRAIRFSGQGAGRKSNGNENIEVKLADTVKADGAT